MLFRFLMHALSSHSGYISQREPGRHVLRVLLGLLFVGAMASSGGTVEPAQPFIRLWSDRGEGTGLAQSNAVFLDIDPTTPGTEILGLAQRPVRSAPDTNHKITLTILSRLEFRAVTGETVILAPTPFPAVRSRKFPDPTDPQFQCGGPHETRYGPSDYGSTCPCSSVPAPGPCFDPQTDLPLENFHVGFGIARVNSVRVLVFGDAITGSYSNNLDGDDIEVSTFMVAVYNMDGSRRWTKSFAGTANGRRLEPQLSGVAAFHTANADEVRIAYIKEASGNATQFRYQFYNLLTGALTSTVDFTTPAP